MIQRKKKTCKGCDKERYIFGRGLCANCYRSQQKPIKKISEKQKSVISEYTKVRRAFLEKNPLCKARLSDCTYIATDVHHLAGKTNREKYLNVENFMPLCRNCHQEIENGGSWVYERGFKLKRI